MKNGKRVFPFAIFGLFGLFSQYGPLYFSVFVTWFCRFWARLLLFFAPFLLLFSGIHRPLFCGFLRVRAVYRIFPLYDILDITLDASGSPHVKYVVGLSKLLMEMPRWY